MFNISEFLRVNKFYFIWAVFLGALYMFRSMFGLVFMTFIMCFIFAGIARKLRRKYHWNRRFIICSIYFIFLVCNIAFLCFVPKQLLSETINFTEQLPKSVSALRSWVYTSFENNEFVMPIINQAETGLSPENTVFKAWNVVRNILEKSVHYIGWFYLAMLFSFLILFDLPELSSATRRLRYTKLAETYKETADSIILFSRVVGENFRAQLIISAINTTLTAIGLYILGVKGIALLCVIVFMCGLIPVLGMWISSVPIILMAINSGGIHLALWALLMIVLIHILEAYVLNPRIVSSVMHINPVMTILILYIAHSLIGMWGMLLGVPIAVYCYRKINVVSEKVQSA